MKSIKFILSQGLGLLAPVAILAAGAGWLSLAAKVPERKIQDTVDTPLVDIATVAAHAGGLDIELDGVVAPAREIRMSAEVAGRITKKDDACRAGRFVARGATLLEIDPSDYQLEVRRTEQQVAQADANLTELDVELEANRAMLDLTREEHQIQQRELLRLQKLTGAVSDSEVDRARRSEWLSRHSLQNLTNESKIKTARRESLQAARELALTQLARAKLDRERTLIVAPADGVVVRDLVEQDSFVAKGEPLLTFEDTSAVEVKCNLQIDELGWLWREAAARFGGAYQLPPVPVTVVHERPGQTARFGWAGVLSRYDGIGVDEKTRTVPCRVVVSDPRSGRDLAERGSETTAPPALLRGMFVRVIVHVAQVESLIAVPEPAVQPGGRVWCVRDGKLAVLGPLRLVKLQRTSRQWLIHPNGSGLTVGDHVVTSPLADAYTGLAVREAESKGDTK